MKKGLRSLPPKFDSKVFAVEEAQDLKTFSMDEMYCSLTTYEMRIGKAKSTDREATFKVNKNVKGTLESDEGEISDDAKANFVKNLRRGKGKYKGKIPLKSFNYGDIRHFAILHPNVHIMKKETMMKVQKREIELEESIKLQKKKL